MEQVFLHAVALLCSFGIGVVLVPVMIRTAKKLSLLDVPDGTIKQHKVPVPYLGGVAIYVAFLATLAIVYPSTGSFHLLNGQLVWFLCGITLLFLIGLIDDLHAFSPSQKFTGQIVAVLCFLKGGFALKSRFFSNAINIFASGFWMLSVINAFNLVDVMDGLSVSLALVSVGGFFVIAFVLQQYLLTLLLTTLAGALLAFFLYNKRPAKIYLGDAGSLFIGGFIAALPLLIQWTHVLNFYDALPSFADGSIFWETAISALVPILLVGLPLLEIVSLIVIRRYKGVPFYQGGPHHFACYLQKKWESVWKTLLFSVLSAVFLAAVAILFMFGIISFHSVVVSVFLFLVTWMVTVYG
jgi:UDP-GlcNAc:undecaprenyl-phosphate GlcNAc-1-phosphate transferase